MPIPSPRAGTLAAVLAMLPLSSTASAQELPQRLDTIRVSVTSRVAPTIASAQRSVEVVGRAEIDRKAARTVTDLLATALGTDVQTRSPAQADIAIRGSSLGQVLVLVDGVRVSDLQTAHFDLDLTVPLDAVERIEILRGPGATLYGPDAVGGVVNVVTRRGEAWRSARLYGGTFGTIGAALSAAAPLGATSLRAAADAERSTGHRDGTDYDMVQASLGADRAIGGGRIAADAGLAVREFGAQDFYAPYPSLERTRAVTAAVRYADDDAAGWRVTAAASGRRHTDDFILRRADPAFYRNIHRSWQSQAELGARRALSDAAFLAIGAEGFDAQLESARLGNRREQRGSAFTEATFGRAAGANVSVGVRVDRSTALGTFASPSLAASLPVHPAVRLRASAGRGLRAPSWTERYYQDPANIASPDLSPERFWAAEIGARALPRWGHVDVAAFVRRADDLIDWVRPAGVSPAPRWTTANLETATYRGLEVAVGVPGLIGIDWAAHATGMSFDAEASEGIIGKYALRPLTQIVGLTASRELTRALRASLDARHAKRVGEAAYLQANARVTYTVQRATLHLDLTNLANADYLDASAKPVAGRAVLVGLRIR